MKTPRRIGPIVLAALLGAAGVAPGKSAYEKLQDRQSEFAEVLLRMKMSELLDDLVGRAAGDVNAALLQIKSKVDRAEQTEDQDERNRLIDEALKIYDRLIRQTKGSTQDADRLRHFRFRLDRMQLLAGTKAKPYVERLEYFLARPGDAAMVAKLTAEAVRESNRLLSTLMLLRDRWAADDEKMITGVLWRLEGLIEEARYRGAWFRYHRAMVMPADEDARPMLLRQAVEDVLKFAQAPDNASGVKFWSLLLAGMAVREIGQWDEARAYLQRADNKEAAAGTRMKAKFELARSYIDQKQYARADAQIKAFRTEAAKLPGVQQVAVDLQSTLLEYRLLTVQAAEIKDAQPKKAAAMTRKAFRLVMDLIAKHPVYKRPLQDLLLSVGKDEDLGQLGREIQLVQARRKMTEKTPEAMAEAEKIFVDIASDEKADDAVRAGALWSLGVLYNQQRKNIPAAKAWVRLAEEYPKDPNAANAAVNAVRSYQGILTERKAAPADMGMPFVQQYAHALRVAIETHGQKRPEWLFELGMMYDILKQRQQAIQYFLKVPEAHRLYMPSQYRILQQRLQDLLERVDPDVQKRRKRAKDLAADLERFMSRCREFAGATKDKRLRADVLRWGADCGLFVADIYKDVLGNAAEATRMAEEVARNWQAVPGVAEKARELIIRVKLEQGKVTEVVGELTGLLRRNHGRAEKLLAMAVPQLGSRIEVLRFATDPASKATLKKLEPAYKLFAQQLYKFALQQDFATEQMEPYKRAWAHAHELGESDEVREALKIYESLNKAHPRRGPYIRGLARCHRRLGAEAAKAGDKAKAAEHYDKAMEYYDRLLDGLPKKSPEWWRMQLERLQFFMETMRRTPSAGGLRKVPLQIRLLRIKDPNMGGHYRSFNAIEAEARRLLERLGGAEGGD